MICRSILVLLWIVTFAQQSKAQDYDSRRINSILGKNECVVEGTCDLAAGTTIGGSPIGGGGDSGRVEDADNAGTFTALSDFDLDDSGDINFVRAAGPPDVVTGEIRAGVVGATELADNSVGIAELTPDPAADDQVLVSDSTAAATWRSVPDCGEAGTLNYTAATNTFSCLTDSGGGGSPGGQTTEMQFNSAGAFEGADNLTVASSTAGVTFGAGSATAGTKPKLTTGTVLTTAEDGAIEMDADAVYLTTDAGNRGYVPVRHCIRADATRNLTSSTAEQALFNAPTNGRLTLETGTYRFEGMFYLSAMSATSGNAAFDPLGAGTATATAWLWQLRGLDNTTVATVGAPSGQAVITQQTAASAVAAATGTAMTAFFDGTVEITGAGTMIPSVTLVTAAAATVNLGSHFCIERLGSTTMTNVGQWD